MKECSKFQPGDSWLVIASLLISEGGYEGPELCIKMSVGIVCGASMGEASELCGVGVMLWWVVEGGGDSYELDKFVFGDSISGLAPELSFGTILSYDPEEHVVNAFEKEYILLGAVGLKL